MNDEDIRHVLFYFGNDAGKEPGHFTQLIMNAYQIADPGNRARLRMAFPGLTQAMETVLRPPRPGEDGMHMLLVMLDKAP